MISAYAPILNSAGDAVGVIGCDLPADIYDRLWSQIIRQLIVSGVFALVGFAAYLYMINGVKNSTVEKGEYLNILKNVQDGLFLLDRNRKIGPYYSTALEIIFRRSDLAGLDVMEVFTGFLDEKTRANSGEFFDVAFDPKISWRYVKRLNPLAEAEAYFDDLSGGFVVRHFGFSFGRIGGEDNVDRLFVLVRDLTEQKDLADEVEKTRNESREEMEMLQHILHIDPEVVLDFLKSVKTDAEAINDELRQGGENFSDRLDTIFRHSHAVKGDAQLVSLDFLADKAEYLEQRILTLRGIENIGAEDFLPLTISCSELMNAIEKLEGIVDKWLRLSGSLRSNLDKGGFTGSLREMAQRLAGRYGKEVELEIKGFEKLSGAGSKRKAIQDILVQLVRNSVYHGIETGEKRRAFGKPEKGRININMKETTNGRQGSCLSITFRDDGGGIDRERIRRNIIAKGIVKPEKAEAHSGGELIRFIFETGFSTAEKPDSVAGKGAGMSLVMAKVRETGGKISLRSRQGVFCEFIFSFPLKYNIPIR
jgi:Amt family ammonium transporter